VFCFSFIGSLLMFILPCCPFIIIWIRSKLYVYQFSFTCIQNMERKYCCKQNVWTENVITVNLSDIIHNDNNNNNNNKQQQTKNDEKTKRINYFSRYDIDSSTRKRYRNKTLMFFCWNYTKYNLFETTK
jgi:hypothetical protein